MEGLRKDWTEAEETRRTLEALGVTLRMEMREMATFARPAFYFKREQQRARGRTMLQGLFGTPLDLHTVGQGARILTCCLL
jgi:hypothetical protein